MARTKTVPWIQRMLDDGMRPQRGYGPQRDYANTYMQPTPVRRPRSTLPSRTPRAQRRKTSNPRRGTPGGSYRDRRTGTVTTELDGGLAFPRKTNREAYRILRRGEKRAFRRHPGKYHKTIPHLIRSRGLKTSDVMRQVRLPPPSRYPTIEPPGHNQATRMKGRTIEWE